MPKNAVQRLNEIESDIKTVISLYEVVNKSKNNNDKIEAAKKQNAKQLSEVRTPRCLEATSPYDKFWDAPGQPPILLLDSFKRTSDFVSRLSQGVNSRESVLVTKWMQKKPGSAPSSSSTVSAISESDKAWQQWSDPGGALEILSRAKTSDNLNNSDWSENCILPVCQAVMTPSKTLQTANEILAQNNFYENDPVPTESVVYPQTWGRDHKSSGEQHTSNVKNNPSKNNQVKKVICEAGNEKDILGSGNSASQRHEISSEQEFELNTPFTCKSTVPEKLYNSKEKPLKKNYPPAYVTPKDNLEINKNVSTSRAQSNLKSTTYKDACSKITKCYQSTEDNRGDKHNMNSNPKFLEQNNSKVRFLVHDKRDKKKKKNSIKNDKKPHFSQASAILRNNQVTQKESFESHKDTELWVNELSKIIEKSNEKLEKMKVSKELALEIAKHFKEKYDEIQRSKDEFMEKMQKVEKCNEKLNAEVKETRESEKKLQLKIEELKDDRMRAIEENIKNKDIQEQNLWLKTKLRETGKYHSAELLEKDKKIEEIQIKRLEETRNILKNQESLTKKIQQLTKEKSEVLTAFEELRRQLRDSLSKTGSLEENIRMLEEEVHKQNEHLRVKTETLQETKRELHRIRQNSTDLEEQVRTLTKNIDEFDGIQQTLIKQTSEYEQQIKSHQEEITELQNENLRLKRELENEKDGLLIKIKIIEDQQETIKQLKEKSEETKALLRKNHSLERILNNEREEKLELQEALERLKWRKEELKKKVKSLENDFLLAPQEVVRNLQKTQTVLHELESQVQMKQKEWELQLQTLIREKEQACSVAEFATKKLMETRNEFQRQSEAYKGLQRILAENLAIRERYIAVREANKKMIRGICSASTREVKP